MVLVLYENTGNAEEAVARGTRDEDAFVLAALTTGAAAELEVVDLGGAAEEEAALTDVGDETGTGAEEEDGAEAATGAEEPPALEHVEPVAHFV